MSDYLGGDNSDILVFVLFSQEVRSQIWSDSPDERLNTEICRSGVAGILSSCA